METKAELRKKIINVLPNVNHQPLDLYQRLFNHQLWQLAKSIAVTSSTKIELDTKPIIEQVKKAGKRLMLPRVFPNHQMEFVEIDVKNQFQLSSFGIMEPVTGNVVAADQIDLIVVPGLAFSRSGHDRLGFGGGFYDRYLKTYHGNTIALALKAQTFSKPIWPVANYDVKIDHILFEADEEK